MLLALPRPASWVSAKLTPRPSPIHGTGLFAVEPVAAGEPCLRIGGRLMGDADFRAWTAGRRQFSALAIDDGLHLVLADDDPARFGNHSCDAALWHADAVTLVTRRAVAAGGEVTVDYAVHTDDSGFTMECRCGSPACRGTVTGTDWRLPGVQERYRGHLTPFLDRRVAGRR